MIKSLSFEKLGVIQANDTEKQPLPSGPYWDDIIIPYQEDLDLKTATDSNRVIAINAFPFESMKHLKFEKRQGSDLSAFVFQKNLKKTYLTSKGVGDQLFVSFLSYYECHPLRIVTHKTKDLLSFYRTEYFEDLRRRLDHLRAQNFSLLNLMFLGNIYALEEHLPRFLGVFKSPNPEKTAVLMISPLQQTDFKIKWRETLPCKFLHVGLDHKFVIDDVPKGPGDAEMTRNIVKGTAQEEALLKELLEQTRKGEVECVHIIWDCEVFASDYFPGRLSNSKACASFSRSAIQRVKFGVSFGVCVRC